MPQMSESTVSFFFVLDVGNVGRVLSPHPASRDPMRHNLLRPLAAPVVLLLLTATACSAAPGCTNDALTVVIAGGTAPDGNKLSFLVGTACSLLLTALPTSDSLMNNVLALPDRATRRWRLRLLDQKSISQARSRCFAMTYQALARSWSVSKFECLNCL